MPSKSPAQARLMRARAHGWKPDRIKGPSVKVAKEFVAADKKAKGYGSGGSAKKMMKKVSRKVLKAAQRGDKGAEAYIRKLASKYEQGKLHKKSRLGKWALEQRGQFDPRPGGLAEVAGLTPERTIDPVPGREFISGAAPPRRVGPPARTAADIAPGFQPSRVPSALLAYLEKVRAGADEEPVKMQFGGAMRGMMQRGRQGRRGFGGRRGQPQPPGGGGLARAAVMPGSAPGPGGGVGQGQPRPQPPGAGVPLRGVGRPPGMGRPGAGGGAGDYQSMLQKRAQAAGRGQPGRAGIGMGMPGGGGPGGVRPAVMPGRGFTPGGGGAGMPGGANRIGMGDQQGAQARAMQVQTGRPPMSRRQPFPGGRSRRSRGRFR